ncbi:MAG: RsmD family RNA methyltransferase [Muribaculaceae bacterium]|nr:RsmD family RNA methyltransferase [Muribaculaceae bacterium]MDE6531933.1 RsmD family RNA methyltransferase [Muribaculaceae bacterium]
MRIIRGKYGRRRFDVPKNITARPTTDFARENLFNVLENLEDFEGKTALDLFAGTGAISFEFLSRGCSEVTSVEQAAVQAQFIRSVKEKLGDETLRVIKGDVFRFISTCSRQFDFIFADPPYDHPRFEEVPMLILESAMVKSGSVVIVEHSKKHDFSRLPGFSQHRVYGSVNFSIFIVK